jgi:uncharacterized protein involved in outer membrane biogenesis
LIVALTAWNPIPVLLDPGEGSSDGIPVAHLKHRGVPMSLRRWLALAVVVLVVAAAGFRLALPELIRQAVVARVHTITGRAASLEAVDVQLLRARVSLRGFRLADRAGESGPFAEFTRLDLHLRLPALLRGHLWLREVVLHDPTVRVIRYPGDEFNLSDLVRQSGETRRILEVTVDRFVLVNGTTTLEDRALSEPRTWRSESLVVEALNLSSRPQYGTAVATSVTGGAPVSVRVERLRLYPIDLAATVTIDGLDLAMGRIYLPTSMPVLLDGGRGTTSVRVTLDARGGLRLDATARVEDVVLTRRDGGALARVPTLTAAFDGLQFGPDGMGLGRLALDASAAVVDPSAGTALRFAPTTLRARITDLTWPVSRPAGVDLSARVQDRGSLAVTGTLQPPTAPSELRLRLDDFDLAPWARFAPLAGRVTGVVEADLRIREPLRVGLPSRIQGMFALKNAGISDGSGRPLQAQRIEASRLELGWPDRLRIGRLAIREPRAVVERGRAGDFAIARLFGSPAGRDSTAPASGPAGTAPGPSPALRIDVGQILVQDGTAEWRDQAVAPPVRTTISALTATVTGATWPISGPLEVRLGGSPTGGGQVQVAGRVGLTPLAADTRVTARSVDLAPYEPYLRLPVRLRAWTDLDLSVAMQAAGEPVSVRGRAALAHVDVRDGERTVFQVQRAAATGLDIDWPGRVAVAHLGLEAPWILMERDKHGRVAIRELLSPKPNGPASPPWSGPEKGPRAKPLAAAIGQLTVEAGGARIVDQSIAPQFALDLRRLAVRVEGVRTTPGPGARIDLTGQAEPGTVLTLRGTVGPIGGPLVLDLRGELRELDAVRMNPYLERTLAWHAAQGLVTVRIEGRVRDEALDARAEVQLSRLQVARAAPTDGAPPSGGLPLNLILALMRDSGGDIRFAFPVGGRLRDPRFDFRETIRSAIRTVAINTITLPVSWIGRLRVSPDSQIERVDVDPIRFQPASAILTVDGQAQASRVAAFLGKVAEVRMALTPVVSERDLATLKRQAAERAVERLAEADRLSPGAAAARLFRERLPGRPVPAEREAMLAALAETEASPALAPALAKLRLETLLALFKEAGIARARLVETPLAERPDTAGGTIDLNVLEPDAPRRSQLLQTLRGLGARVVGD